MIQVSLSFDLNSDDSLSRRDSDWGRLHHDHHCSESAGSKAGPGPRRRIITAGVTVTVTVTVNVTLARASSGGPWYYRDSIVWTTCTGSLSETGHGWPRQQWVAAAAVAAAAVRGKLRPALSGLRVRLRASGLSRRSDPCMNGLRVRVSEPESEP